MKKLILGLIFLASISIVGQNKSAWEQDYYGSGNTSYSNNLRIAVNDTTTGEYYVDEQLIMVQVDSNWTASNLGVWIYNPYEEVYEPLYDEDGTLVEITVVQGTATVLPPAQFAGIKRCKFSKITSGAYVAQATTPSTLIVTYIRY